jgi:hypothetical protein
VAKTVAEVSRLCDLLKESVDAAKGEIAILRESLHETNVEAALLRQRLDDHLKRMDVWGGRLWAFVLALIGAVLSLAAGLIVTLTKK